MHKTLVVSLAVIAAGGLAVAQTASQTTDFINRKAGACTSAPAKGVVADHSSIRIAKSYVGEQRAFWKYCEVKWEDVRAVSVRKGADHDGFEVVIEGDTKFFELPRQKFRYLDQVSWPDYEQVGTAKTCDFKAILCDRAEAEKIMKAVKHMATESGAKLEDDLF